MSDDTFGPKIFPPLGPYGSGGAIEATGWDRAMIAGQVVPGQSRITNGGILIKIQKKSKDGANGANPTLHGLDPQPIDMEITTHSNDEREALASMVAGLVPKITKNKKLDPKPVSFDHPSVRHLGIGTVLLIKVGAFIVVSPNVAKLAIGLIHWMPATDGATTGQFTAPKRTIDNERKGTNKKPTEQPGFGGPPAGLKQVGQIGG